MANQRKKTKKRITVPMEADVLAALERAARDGDHDRVKEANAIIRKQLEDRGYLAKLVPIALIALILIALGAH